MKDKNISKGAFQLIKWKFLAEKWKEIVEWKLKNSTQKWFFSLEEKEQDFLERIYIIVVQMCPELSWEDYLDRLRKIDNYDKWAKSVVKLVRK